MKSTKKTGPVVRKASSFEVGNPIKSNWKLKLALVEDDPLFYFVAFSSWNGFVAIPSETELQSILLFQMALDGIRSRIKSPINDSKTATSSEIKLSWDWIREETKNGKNIISSYYHVDVIKAIFGISTGNKILDFIK